MSPHLVARKIVDRRVTNHCKFRQIWKSLQIRLRRINLVYRPFLWAARMLGTHMRQAFGPAGGPFGPRAISRVLICAIPRKGCGITHARPIRRAHQGPWAAGSAANSHVSRANNAPTLKNSSTHTQFGEATFNQPIEIQPTSTSAIKILSNRIQAYHFQNRSSFLQLAQEKSLDCYKIAHLILKLGQNKWHFK